jgi:hypothetical protein
MWRPLQKTLYRYALSLISNNIGMPQTAVDSVSVWGIPPSILKLKLYYLALPPPAVGKMAV